MRGEVVPRLRRWLDGSGCGGGGGPSDGGEDEEEEEEDDDDEENADDPDARAPPCAAAALRGARRLGAGTTYASLATDERLGLLATLVEVKFESWGEVERWRPCFRETRRQ